MMFVEANDPQSVSAINGMKSQNPKMKLIMSVGGWNFPSAYWSKMASSSASRAKFISSANSFMSQHSFDGIDIDWEFAVSPARTNPVKITCTQFRTVQDAGGSSADTQNTVLLFKELRAGCPSASISFASQANLDKAKAGSVALLSPYLDYFHLMTYDYTVSDVPNGVMFSPNCPLYNPPQPAEQMSIDYTVQGYLAMGVPSNKLQLGVAFYGHAWWNPSLTTSQWQTWGGKYGKVQGLCCGPFVGTTGAKPGKGSGLCGSMMYSEIVAAGFTNYYDNKTQSDIGYLAKDSADGYTKAGTWITYNGKKSLTAISEYALKMNLAGVFSYDSSMDSVTGGAFDYQLSKLIVKTLAGGGPTPGPTPAPTPNPGGHTCTPAGSCNVCAACCQTYLKNPSDCDACVLQQCKPNICTPAADCNVCSACCQTYLKDQTDCDSCTASQC